MPYLSRKVTRTPVANAAALGLVDTSDFDAGVTCQVIGLGEFVYTPSSVAGINNYTVIATLSGTGRWLINSNPVSASYTMQATTTTAGPMSEIPCTSLAQTFLAATDESEQQTALPWVPTASDIQDSSFSYVNDTGVVNAYVAVLSPAVTGYVAGLRVLVKIVNSNTSTTPTLQVNGLAAKTIILLDGGVLGVNDLLTTMIADFIYDGTHFQLQNPATTSSGIVPTLDGGTGAALTPSGVGGLLYGASPTTFSVSAATVTANQLVLSGASAAPSYSTSTYPSTNAVNTLLYASSVNTMAALPTAVNGVLITSAGGVPSIGATLPTAVQGNITATGTIATGTWQGTVITGTYGGTGVNNASKTITLGGNLTTSGAFNTTVTVTGTTSVTLPTSGALITSSNAQTGYNYALDTGVVNASVVTLSPAPASYTVGMIIYVKIAVTNTGGVSINVNGLGVKAITTLQATAVAAGTYVQNNIAILIYDGTNFLFINPAFLATQLGIQQNSYLFSFDSGTANNYVLAVDPIPTAYTISMPVCFFVGHTNTSSSQVNVNGLGIRNITLTDGTVLTGGELVANTIAYLTYNSNNNAFQILNPANINTTTLSASKVGVQNSTYTYVADTGAVNAYVATLSPAISSYTAGLRLQVKIANTNTSSTATLNVNGLGTISIKLVNGSNPNIGDILLGMVGDFIYDGTNFQLQNPVTLESNLTGDVTSVGSVTTYNGILPLSKGGAASAITASNGGIVYSTASALAVLAGTSTAGQIIRSGASTTPSWSTSTYPATNAINTLLYASSANVMSALATAVNGVLVTDGTTGIPSIGSTLPSAVQGNITATGTIASGTWQGTVITGTYGGTGVNNASKTITLGGNLTTSGAFNTTLTSTATTSVTLPTSGTLTNTSNVQTGYNYALDTGVVNASVITLSPALTSYTTGLVLYVKVAVTNTSAVTINVNGLGVKSTLTLEGTSVIAGTYAAGNIAVLVYDGTNFMFLNPAFLAARSGVQKGTYVFSFDSGTANAYALSLDPVPTGYNVGMLVSFFVANSNTTSSTVNVNGLGLVPITYSDGTALTGGELVANNIAYLAYNNVSFDLINPANINTTTLGASKVGVQNSTYTYVADTGAVNAYVSTLTPAVGSYTTGLRLQVKIVNTNTSATTTLNVNGLGTKSIKLVNGSNPGIGDIRASMIADFIYDGTNFQLLNPTNSALPTTATASQLLLSGASTSPTFTTSTYPTTNAINTLLYASSANVMSALATANSGTLITSSGGVPSISSTLPSAVQTNITALGTVTTGTINGANLYSTVNTQTGTTYTLALSDSGKTVTFNNASAITVTLPQQSNVALPANFFCWFINLGAGSITFVKEGAETLTGNTAGDSGSQGLIYRNTSTNWNVAGGTVVLSGSFTLTVETVGNVTYNIARANGTGTITNISSICRSGTATSTAAIAGTNVTATANAVSTSNQTQAVTALGAFVAGNYITTTISANSTCLDMCLTLDYTYRLNV